MTGTYHATVRTHAPSLIPPTPRHAAYYSLLPPPFIIIKDWLIESESETASTDPLVLWLNGGPGSSSLIGLLNENGQIKVNDDSLDVPAGETPASFYNK